MNTTTDAEEPPECAYRQLLTALGGYKRELIETARLRAKAKDTSAELAFLSAAERLVEIVGPFLPTPKPTAEAGKDCQP